jgi:hypothetical protein
VVPIEKEPIKIQTKVKFAVEAYPEPIRWFGSIDATCFANVECHRVTVCGVQLNDGREELHLCHNWVVSTSCKPVELQTLDR